jgi:hypothetical protein
VSDECLCVVRNSRTTRSVSTRPCAMKDDALVVVRMTQGSASSIRLAWKHFG